MTIKKFSHYLITTLLVSGVIVTVGFLSFTGMLLITPKIWVAIASFIFAGGVEGEVYAQNIFKAMHKLTTKNYLRYQLIDRTLHDLIKDNDKLNACQFLQDYKAQLDYLKELRKGTADKAILKKEEKRFRLMRQKFSRLLKKAVKNDYPAELITMLETKDAINNLNKEIKRKTYLNRFMTLFYVLAGISCGFASLYSVHSGILTLMTTFGFTLTPTVIFGGIIPLAILAGIGYGYIMFRAVSDMIEKGFFQKVKQKMQHYFTYNKGENKFLFGLKCVGIGIASAGFIGLCVLATILTAGTWWYAVNYGVKLIPIIAKAAHWVRNISVVAMTIPTVLYNLKNTLSTLKKIGHFSLTRNIKEGWHKLKVTWKEENIIQFFNPFRIFITLITAPFQLISFISHLIAIGVTADRFPKNAIPVKVAAGINVGNEAGIDAHFFMEGGNNAKGQKAPPGTIQQTQHSKHKAHDHEHGLIIKNFLKMVLSPFYLASATWAYVFRSNKQPTDSFKNQLRKTFGFSKKEKIAIPPAPKISNEWKKQEILMKLDKKIKRYKKNSLLANNEATVDKFNLFSHIRTKFSNASLYANDEGQQFGDYMQEALNSYKKHPETKNKDAEAINRGIMTNNRYRLFNKKKVKSQKFYEKLINNEDYASLRMKP